MDPNQKERIILAVKKLGHVVGFLGDGVNDAPAMHAADTSLSVAQAVDVAREAADFVLLEPSLDVIRRGIEEGRRTFANTLKYVLTTMSANLGNMISMAAASLFLPFLPLLAGQILLNNFLSDVPAVGFANDAVDAELTDRPRRWDMGFIARYMVGFGAVSSAFDFAMFGVCCWCSTPRRRCSGRGGSSNRCSRSWPSRWWCEPAGRSFAAGQGRYCCGRASCLPRVTLALPYLSFIGVIGLVPLPLSLVVAILTVTALYVGATELLKVWFYRVRPVAVSP